MASNDSNASQMFGSYGGEGLLKSAEKGSYGSQHNSGMRMSGDRSSGPLLMNNTTTQMLSTSTNPQV